jgi:hypothetical protein
MDDLSRATQLDSATLGSILSYWILEKVLVQTGKGVYGLFGQTPATDEDMSTEPMDERDPAWELVREALTKMPALPAERLRGIVTTKGVHVELQAFHVWLQLKVDSKQLSKTGRLFRLIK